jgi:hypothetical protein
MLSPEEENALISFYLPSETALRLLSFPNLYKVKLRCFAALPVGLHFGILLPVGMNGQSWEEY